MGLGVGGWIRGAVGTAGSGAVSSGAAGSAATAPTAIDPDGAGSEGLERLPPRVFGGAGLGGSTAVEPDGGGSDGVESDGLERLPPLFFGRAVGAVGFAGRLPRRPLSEARAAFRDDAGAPVRGTSRFAGGTGGDSSGGTGGKWSGSSC